MAYAKKRKTNSMASKNTPRNNICVVAVYFGKLPEYFNLWLKSCFYNSEIDFYVFTDQAETHKINNVTFVNMNLDNFHSLIESKLGMKVALPKPYKCCDFRPAYGLILDDYIGDYAYWAHCDLDMIFGNIMKFLEKFHYDKFDKFLALGHLAFYRNTARVNNAFKLFDNDTKKYIDVFQSDNDFAFDERNGILPILKHNGFLVFEKRIFADISSIYSRFRRALDDPNYAQQIFYWENGEIYEEYYEENNIRKTEFIYIHFKKRQMGKADFETESANSFYIGPTGFHTRRNGDNFFRSVKKYNPYRGRLFERRELMLFRMKELTSKIIRKIRARNVK